MLNQAIVCGRLTAEPEIKETETGRKVCNITIAVPRSYKNAEGVYETDFIPVVLWNVIAENTAEWCKKGDLIGIKGRLQEREGKIELIAERVTILSSKMPDGESEE